MLCSEKRAEIINASLELIAECGFHGAPISKIAENAKVAAGTIYCYFENKDALIIEIYRDLEARLYQIIMQDYCQKKPIRERFHHIIKALLSHFVNSPLDFRYLEQFHNSPYGVAVRRDIIFREKGESNIYRELLEDGVSQQVIKNLPMVILFALAFAPLKAVIRDHILGFIQLDADMIDRVMEASWDGIRR